jgi:hypothetical protein
VKGQIPRTVIVDEVHYWASDDLAEYVRPNYPEPSCCEPCAARWGVLTDLADALKGAV